MDRRAFLIAGAGVGALGFLSGIRALPREDQSTDRPEDNSDEPLPESRGEHPILDGGRLGIRIDDTNAPVVEGEEVFVAFSAFNTGRRTMTRIVSLIVDDEIVDSVEVTVDGADIEQSTLRWQTDIGDGSPGQVAYRLAIQTVDDRDAVSVNVQQYRPVRAGMQFDRMVDAVDHLGMDATGHEPIDPIIETIPDRTLVRFRDGTYRFEGQASINEAHLGFEGVGDVTFAVPSGYNDYLMNGSDIQAFFLKGVTVDQTAEYVSPGFRLVGEHIHVEDVTFDGRVDIYDQRAINMFNCSINDPDGYGELRNVVSTEGHWARYGPGSGGRIGVYTGHRHHGTLKIVDCDFREFGNNALYCSRNFGDVQVEDSYFENNNAAAIRIGGEGSYAENCEIVNDPALYTGPRTFEETGFTHRGIVIEERFTTSSIVHQKPPGAEVRNCSIRVEDNPANGAAIHRYGNGRALYVEDTDIEYNNNGEVAAVRISTGTFGINPQAEPPHYLNMVNSSITGTGDVDAAISLTNANGSLIDNCDIEMREGNQHGVIIQYSVDCEIRNTSIAVPNEPINAIGSSVETFDVSFGDPGEP